MKEYVEPVLRVVGFVVKDVVTASIPEDTGDYPWRSNSAETGSF